MSCTLDQRRDFQRLQNDDIRKFLLYSRREHNEVGIISLEQRRNMQLLKLLFVRSKVLRFAPKIKLLEPGGVITKLNSN